MNNRILQILMLLCFMTSFSTWAQQEETFSVKGVVLTGESKQVLPGAIILFGDKEEATITDSEGKFVFKLPAGEVRLEIKYLGYESKFLDIVVPIAEDLIITMNEDGMSLDAVEIVSTGYQQLPKERATGSFVQIENELVNRRISTNILDRLEDVTPGLIFNRTPSDGSDPISIRGRGTLFANTQPLIIIDNFPYDGPLESINPNDVESITVLRDAAAASIWGARAGNGVIVITTKLGRINQPISVSVNANITITEVPDLYYRPRMPIGDFIDVERNLFQQGYYNNQENAATRPRLSPMVESLIAHRDGLLSENELNARIDAFRNRDLRRDLEHYYYQNSINQQYSAEVSGGSQQHRYIFSAGYDNNTSSIRDNGSDRITLNARNNWKFLNNKLQVNIGAYIVHGSTYSHTGTPSGYAYDQLADQAGNPLPITGIHSQRYIASQAGMGLLDWNYVPLQEIGILDNTSKNTDYRINTSLGYEIIPGLNAEIQHQYWQNDALNRNLLPLASYEMRNLINTYTQVLPDGTLSRPIPVGGRLGLGITNAYSNNLRGQLRYSKNIKGRHDINAVGGYEIKEGQTEINNTTYYGYDDAIGISTPVDYTTLFRSYVNPSATNAIPAGMGHRGIIDRFLSYYVNATYSLDNTFQLSLSTRKDQSNLFGVETNMRGVPLWSAGAGWTLSNMKFYNFGFLPYLKLKYTYGYNGNIDRSLSAFTTAAFVSRNLLIPGVPYAQIINPPNPDLRWERMKISNIALDFETKEGRLYGSVEMYTKTGIDLIGDAPFPAASGQSRVRGNFADTRTKGVDVSLSGVNVKNRDFEWKSDFMYSHVSDEVVSYQVTTSVANYLGSSSGTIVPLEGRPLISVYSYEWAGLDPTNGQPMGFLDGEPSTNYSGIIGATSADDLVFHGSARPTHFGALRNTFRYKGFSLSMNISYRLGYYYRRESINYNSLLSGVIGHGDYINRWQSPGDETTTNIPGIPNAINNQRQTFYQFSAALVEPGDHIRFQDVRISYVLDKKTFPYLPFKRAEVYSYINNIGILWKASDDVLDPDFRSSRPLRSIAFGLRLDL
ncbi:SusC/RagA family TonB-linked outer membrane protein [Belliella kenyensis]|uniref:SusC/RagA family TonB-linked outer membrane protein n=1 Tax=Belliella kenyensis TaxID=1472724 RepID=A0ABV8ELT8_9BACT|nr:SusC/RagA family TonB-linked outer membrane protein [Belliella kenyensis]MCH7400876.1 SusC/RagA family TonB-linked outer membrane protein [Belliella kenyensis]MDN3601837.1 SusC/RagA family TonB-linked outer membrane protein [Belliella kenyensis]